jgi:hypothetical protein
MITKETATQIARRGERLEQINYCLKNMANITATELELSFCKPNQPDKREVESFTVSNDDVIELLERMGAYEIARLDELNTLAVQEAQSINSEDIN